MNKGFINLLLSNFGYCFREAFFSCQETGKHCMGIKSRATLAYDTKLTKLTYYLHKAAISVTAESLHLLLNMLHVL